MIMPVQHGSPLAREMIKPDCKHTDLQELGEVRTRDPLLRRHLAGVAGGRLESFYMAISCVDRGWAWLEVALELSPLAPFLAPPI